MKRELKRDYALFLVAFRSISRHGRKMV